MILDIAPTELLVLGVVALIVIPPKDLPRALRLAGQWVGRARGLARQFRSGFDDMIRESEFKEMEAKWKAENERIMRDFPPTGEQAALMAPVPQDDPAELMDTDTPAVMIEQSTVAPEPRAKKVAVKRSVGAKPAAKRAEP